jgi:hypothetical protein
VGLGSCSDFAFGELSLLVRAYQSGRLKWPEPVILNAASYSLLVFCCFVQVLPVVLLLFIGLLFLDLLIIALPIGGLR